MVIDRLSIIGVTLSRQREIAPAEFISVTYCSGHILIRKAKEKQNRKRSEIVYIISTDKHFAAYKILHSFVLSKA